MKRNDAMIVKEAALPTDYVRWIQTVKDRVRAAQLRTMVAVNVEQLLLYWDIRHDILERQKNEGWGAKVIQKMSEDLQCEFPTNNGFSIRNLKYMRAFAAAWPNRKLIVQAPLAQLAWYSQIALIEKLKTEEDRLGYARLAVENHWLRPQLVREIAARSIENLGKSRNRVVVEYALKNVNQPIAVSTYELEKMGIASPRAITDGLVRLLEK